MLVAAKICGEIFERLRQPGVLGELAAGIVLGNLVLFGFTGAETLKTNETIAALAELGVIILLFEVGLESDLKEMIEVGWSSLLVAVVGVVAPFFPRLGSIGLPGSRRVAAGAHLYRRDALRDERRYYGACF
jgi:Kef-type K+ transport system membrane component KefB